MRSKSDKKRDADVTILLNLLQLQQNERLHRYVYKVENPG